MLESGPLGNAQDLRESGTISKICDGARSQNFLLYVACNRRGICDNNSWMRRAVMNTSLPQTPPTEIVVFVEMSPFNMERAREKFLAARSSRR